MPLKDSKPNVVLVVDNPVRDLPGQVLLAMELAKQGARAFLVPMKLQIPEIYLCSPDYVLLPYARVNNAGLIEDLVARGVKVGVLETEGALFEELIQLHLASIAKESIRSQLSHVFMWGEIAHEIALKHKLYQQQQLFATGSPRFDYYSGVFRHALWALEPQISEFNKPIILLITGYTMANPRFHPAETEFENQIKRYNYDPEYAQQILFVHRTNLEKMIELASLLAESFPEVTFILRPHPFENEKTYLDRLPLDKLSNLHVLRLGTIDQWITRSSLLIHRGSTTSLEAAICDVLSITPGWMPILSVSSRDQLSIETSDIDMLKVTIQNILGGRQVVSDEFVSLKNKIIGETYGELDGNNHVRITEVILVSLLANRLKSPIDLKLAEWFLPTDSIRQRLRKRIIQAFNLPLNLTFERMRQYNQPIAWDSSGKRFSVQDVQKIVDAVVTHVADFHDIRYNIQQGVFPDYRYLNGRTIVLERID